VFESLPESMTVCKGEENWRVGEKTRFAAPTRDCEENEVISTEAERGKTQGESKTRVIETRSPIAIR
jgi:hypothetical protein